MYLAKKACGVVICKCQIKQNTKTGSDNNDILPFHGTFIFQVRSMSAGCSLTSLGQEILASCLLFCWEP